MAKNKGGREVRKPKQDKKPKPAAGTPSPLRVEHSAKPQRANTR